MKCLKCGRETDQTFCQACREEMEKYPVKPGTIVLLPKERPSGKKTPSRHPAVPPEVIMQNQRRTIRRLGRGFAVLLVLTVLMGVVIVRLVEESGQRPVGQNYSTVTKPSEETTAAAPQSLDDLGEASAVAPAELEDYIFYLEESQEASELEAEEAARESPTAAPEESEIVPRET